MRPTMCYIQFSILHVIYKTVFLIDTAAVLSLQITGQWFWFSDPIAAAIAFNVFYELVDSLQSFLVL